MTRWQERAACHRIAGADDPPYRWRCIWCGEQWAARPDRDDPCDLTALERELDDGWTTVSDARQVMADARMWALLALLANVVKDTPLSRGYAQPKDDKVA